MAFLCLRPELQKPWNGALIIGHQRDSLCAGSPKDFFVGFPELDAFLEVNQRKDGNFGTGAPNDHSDVRTQCSSRRNESIPRLYVQRELGNERCRSGWADRSGCASRSLCHQRSQEPT
jgi:hypothetical protein